MKGHVITARGDNLNLDELINEAYKPFIKNEASEVKRQIVPDTRAINVRGFKPSLGEGMITKQEQKVSEKDTKPEQNKKKLPSSSFTDDNTASNLAEVSGLKIKKAKHIKERPEDPMSNSEETVNEILGDLSNQYGNKKIEEK